MDILENVKQAAYDAAKQGAMHAVKIGLVATVGIVGVGLCVGVVLTRKAASGQLRGLAACPCTPGRRR